MPEFLVGTYAARLYRRLGWFPKGSAPDLIVGGALFVLTAVCGTSFRYLLFGIPAPGFISFGFGIAVVTEPAPA